MTPIDTLLQFEQNLRMYGKILPADCAGATRATNAIEDRLLQLSRTIERDDLYANMIHETQEIGLKAASFQLLCCNKNEKMYEKQLSLRRALSTYLAKLIKFIQEAHEEKNVSTESQAD